MKTILALLLLATPTLADHCRVRNNAVVIQSTGAIVTPFAVPVAVPVQVATPYVYQHASLSAAAVDPDYAEFLAWKQAKAKSPQVAAAVVPQTLLQQNCVKCHTENADAREHFDMSKELTADQKLAASRALLKGVMPKGKAIDDKTRGNLLGELLGVEETK